MGRCPKNKCGGVSTGMQVNKFSGITIPTRSVQKTTDSTSALLTIDHDTFIDWDFESGGSIQAWAVEFYFRSNMLGNTANGWIGKANGSTQLWSIEVNRQNDGQIHLQTQTDSTANADAFDMWIFAKGGANTVAVYTTNTWVHLIVRHSDRGYSAGDARNFDFQLDGSLYTHDGASTGDDTAGGVAISRNNNVGKSIGSTGDMIIMNIIEDNVGIDLNERMYQLVLYNGLISTANMLLRYNSGVVSYPNQVGLPVKSVYKFEGNYIDSEGNLSNMTEAGAGWNYLTDTP